MSVRTSLHALLKIRAATEEDARAALVRAQDRLGAHELELGAATLLLTKEQGELERLLTGTIDLGAVALRRAGLAALERRESALVRLQATLGFEVEAKRRALDTARAERRVVEELIARRQAELDVENRRTEARRSDDAVATHAAANPGGPT